jgi:hybrid polyketide synthase/nonribosomal peptide synthetase ACE1
MDCLDKSFVKAIFTSDYYVGYKALDVFVSRIILCILGDMKISHYLQKSFVTVDEVVDHFNFHSQSKTFMTWMLTYLEQMGYVQKRHSAYKMTVDIPYIETKETASQIIDLIPSVEIFVKLVEHIKMNINNFLLGIKSGRDILFTDRAAAELWNNYFNNNFYGYSVLNYGVAYGITKWYSQTGGNSMLEIGSGTSGATMKVFQMLRDNNLLDSIDTIKLTDVVPSLLYLGNKNITKGIKNPPSYEQRILDINKEFGDQEFQKESFDIIYGVNVLHIARDLGFSLWNLYNCLNKNGILVIAETTRPVESRAMHHEIIFNLLENYYSVKLDAEMRPTHGFLTKNTWISNFEKAGFSNIDCITELERYDELDFDIKPLHSFLVLKGQK